MSRDPHSARCSWCGRAVEADDGYRLVEVPGERHAIFCRLEHVIPWAIRGAHWEPGGPTEPPAAVEQCAQCEASLGDVRVVLVRHRGEHRITDAFCSVEHLTRWAKAGGRWR